MPRWTKQSEKKSTLEKRGWYFTKKENRYIGFIAGDKDNTLISCSTVKRLLQRAVELEKRRGTNVFNLFFTDVPSIMIDEIQRVCKTILNDNTDILDFSANGIGIGSDKNCINFKFYQLENDASSVLSAISERRILKYVDFTESKLV